MSDTDTDTRPAAITTIATIPAILLDADGAAAALGIGSVTFRAMVADKRLPGPRQIGRRGSRWLVSELMEAAARLPRNDCPPGPWRRRAA